MKAKFEKALAILVLATIFVSGSCLAQNVKKAEALTARGDELLESGDADGARKFYDQAMEADFLFAEARFGMARSSLLKGDHDAALNHVNKAISLKPYEKKYRDFLLDLQLTSAAKAREAGNFEKASSLVKAALKIDENSPRANMALHDVEEAAGNHQNAADALAAMLERDNSRVKVLEPAMRAEVLLKMASALLASGDGQAAWKAIQKADREGKLPPALTGLREELLSEERNPLGFALEKAARAWDSGSLDEAAKLYERALTLAPSIAGVRERLETIEKTRAAFSKADEAATLLSAGKTAEALKACEEALVLDPECSRAQAVFEKVSARAASEREEAVREATAIEERKKSETFVAYHVEQARIHFSKKEYDLAKTCVEKALAKMPDSVEAIDMSKKIEAALGMANTLLSRQAEGAALFDRGAYAEALPIFRELSQSPMTTAEIRSKLAGCLAETGSASEAEELYRVLRSEMKDSAIPHRGLASIAMASGRSEEAREHLAEGLKRDPADQVLLEIKASLDKAEGAARKEQIVRMGGIAIAALFVLYVLGRIRSGYPAWKAARILSGARGAMNSKRWAVAAAGFEAFLSSPVPDRTSRAKAAADLARCLIEAGRAREGLGAAREAMKLDPKNARTRCLLAQAFLKLGDTGDEALAEYRGMMKFEPGNTDLVKAVARCLMTRGDRDREARDAFETAIAKGYDDKEIRAALLQTLMAIGATDHRAVTAFEKALAAGAGDEVREAMLKACLASGEHRKVADTAKELLNRDPGNMAFHKYYTDAMTDLGLAAEAAGEYEALSAGKPDDRDLASLARKLRAAAAKKS